MTAREEGRGGGGGGMRGRAWCPLHLAASLQLSESAKSEQKQRKKTTLLARSAPWLSIPQPLDKGLGWHGAGSILQLPEKGPSWSGTRSILQPLDKGLGWNGAGGISGGLGPGCVGTWHSQPHPAPALAC